MINIAIDGPAGAGKSTLARRISSELKIAYLDTGAMYRGAAYFALLNNILPEDEENVKKILPLLKLYVRYERGEQRIYLDDKDITPFIREHNISMAASTISKIPEVRIKLVELQREIAGNIDCVLDGRDIGTYVLPNARYKFFITASLEERAKRRYLELSAKGINIKEEDVLRDIEARDKQDSGRKFAPLKAAEDAVVIDTTFLDEKETLAEVMKYLCDKK